MATPGLPVINTGGVPGFGVGLPNTRMQQPLVPPELLKPPVGGPVLPSTFPPTGYPGTPFDPAAQPEQPAVAAPAGGTDMNIPGLAAQPRGGVSGWLSRPENRAALLQAAVILMQPPSLGQSPIGQVGQALGGAVEAKDRNVSEQQRQEQLIVTNMLEKQKADAETARANAAMIAARRSSAGGLTYYQQLQLARGYQKDFDIWVNNQVKNAEFSSTQDPIDPNDPATYQWLLEQYAKTHPGAVIPGQAQGAGAAGAAVPAGTTLTEAAPGAPAVDVPADAVVDLQRLHKEAADPAAKAKIEQQFEQHFGLPAGGAKKYLGAAGRV